jgi:tripartite-type tricarboxylate transporter receptor subunit TctC
MSDLLGGQVQAIFSTMPPVIAHVKAGRLRALAITSTTRSEALPDLPAIADFLPGYEAILLNGIGAPRNTPADVIAKLNKEISAIVTDPTTKARLADLGNEPLVLTPEEFGKLLAAETDKWGNLIRTAHLKPT